MGATRIHKRRLEELLDLAQAYRGCNRKQLARQLGRDASNLVPESGVPKVDLVIELARVLDWPVEDVIEALSCDGAIGDEAPPAEEHTFEAIDKAAGQAHRSGRYAEMVDLARQAYAAATCGEDRVRACNREAGGWDGQGRFREGLLALQRGLREPDVSLDRRLLLQANLANAYYTLWHLFEGRGVASDVIRSLKPDGAESIPARIALATAHYVRGNCYRRMLGLEPQRAADLARRAHRDLTRASRLYEEMAEDRQDDSYRGIANTCRGGIMEVEVVLGRRDAESVLDEYTGAMDALVDPSEFPVGDWLESYGWWCIFGCNVALRHVTDDRRLQQTMAVFTNKADEIADRLGNWSMRERVFTLEYARRQRFADWTGVDTEWTIDHEDVRVITGTMGRFPTFHRTGWQILRTAKVIAKN
jgi:hypothetical protein